MFIVYVIQSGSGVRYIGQTDNLSKRLTQYNQERSFFTRRAKNWRVVYKEEYSTRRDAIIRERWLKSGKGREYLSGILTD